MKKTYKRILKITSLALLTAILTIVIVLLFPQRLFAHKLNYKNFTVCANNKIDLDIKLVLDNATSLVRESELYDPSYKYNIILCHNTFYNKIHSKLLGKEPAGKQTLNNVVIKVRIDPKSNLAFPTYRKACEIKLSYLFAHEMIHCLQTNKYGILRINPIKHPEFWKLEGYPEYISRKPELSVKEYNLANEIDGYVNLRSKATDTWIADKAGGCEAPYYYLKGRLMIEYLMDIRHLSYDQILKDTASESTIYNEMINWKDSTREIKNQ